MEQIREVLGYAAAFCTTVAFFPQFIKVWKTRSVKDISLVMYVVFCTGLLLWIAYGVLAGALHIILANGLTFLLAFGVLLFKLKSKEAP